MPLLQRIELSEVIARLPSLKPLARAAAPCNESLFIAALGFEDRCTAVATEFKSGAYRAQQALYLEYSTNEDDNNRNRSNLLGTLNVIAKSVAPLPLDGPGAV